MMHPRFGRFLRRFVKDDRMLAASVAGVGGLKVGAMVLGVLTTMFLARILGPDRLGQYAFAFATASLLALPFLQGLPVLVLRESSGANVERRAQHSARLMRFSLLAVCVAAFVLFFVAALILDQNSASAFGSDLLLTGTALAIPLVLVLTLCLGAVLRAKGHAVAGQVPDLVVRPGVYFVLLVIGWFWLDMQAGEAMALHLLAAFIALGVALYRVVRLKALAPGGPDPLPIRAWALALLPLSTLAGMQLVNGQIGLVILGLLGQDSDVGIYRVATLLALQVSFMLAVVTAVVAPSFAKLHKDGRWEELRRLNRLSASLAMSFGSVLFVVYLVAGRWLLDVAVGTGFATAYGPLIILSAAHVVSLWAGTTNVLLTMIGHERDVLACATASVCANIILGYLLVPRFGTVGAACAAAFALIVWRALLSWRLARRMAEGREQA
jgi:O-antigen/teichoic acid export membrane protein